MSGTSGGQGHSGAKTEPHEDDGKTEGCTEPLDASCYVGGLIGSVMSAFAQAGSAEVKAQHWPTQAPLRRVHRLHGMIDNFVVEVAAAERMRMTQQYSGWSIFPAFIEDGFEPARGA